ncbi:unnamed protein product [Gongylonema pulchrum]|uniref:Uncharacterized protein n=1 Tax=Gongylonema pulchrum TaxID=637853 RepID=A0A3P6QUM6_9BILA|nr:unnamed protein product [Gongylonema pulchrum]
MWVDVCKYHLQYHKFKKSDIWTPTELYTLNFQDKQQKCLRDPNAFKNFINEISSQAAQIRRRSGSRP